MTGQVRVFRVRSIPISIHASWLVVYALVTWTLAVGYFPEVLPRLPASRHWVDALIAAGLLFVSVLLHELAHAVVAQAHGLRVRGITLHIFGGVSELDEEPPSPRAELLIAAAGPAVSLAIAAALWLVGGTGRVRGGSLGAIVGYLCLVNVAVGAFNLLPGFPLDGGRILRALVWWRGGSLVDATRAAGRVGSLLASVLIGFGALRALTGSLMGGLWLVAIGAFLRSAARASVEVAALRAALEGLRVADVMTRDEATVPSYATASGLAEALWEHRVTALPVIDAGGLTQGVVGIQQLEALPRARWPFVRVAELMRPLDPGLVAHEDEDVMRAYERAARNGLGEVVVLDAAGRVAGRLDLEDIARARRLRRPGDGSAAPRPRRWRDAA